MADACECIADEYGLTIVIPGWACNVIQFAESDSGDGRENLMQTAHTRIVPYLAVRQLDGLETALDAIFFEASATKSFADDGTRAAFRERWLGSYLVNEPEHCFMALGACDSLAGYLVGSQSNQANDASHADLPYLSALRGATRDYPAHLHVNVAAAHRSSGLGARLIEVFSVHAAAHRVTGIHVVTAKASRNVGFYLANGFHQLAEVESNGRTLLLLGRRIG